jgi:purine-binding chemotaxis protein CheW
MSEHTQYITLGIGEESFAIPIAHVQEILDLRPIARLPHAPACLVGLIDVRGQSVPVMDLRALLSLGPVEPGPGTRILVLEVMLPRGPLRLGLVVDRVFEVCELDNDTVDARRRSAGHGGPTASPESAAGPAASSSCWR